MGTHIQKTRGDNDENERLIDNDSPLRSYWVNDESDSCSRNFCRISSEMSNAPVRNLLSANPYHF